MPQAVLGVAFSFGIPMAFAAVRGEVPALAWVLLVANMAWVLAYDTEYAMVDREDDLRIGIQTSAITLGRWDVAAVMGFYALYLGLWTLAVWQLLPPGTWLWPIAAAAGVGAAQAIWHYRLIRGREREGCFRAFRLNHWIGCALFVGLAPTTLLR
jgi:4-hydroxybenzoate polyprenyltransferase